MRTFIAALLLVCTGVTMGAEGRAPAIARAQFEAWFSEASNWGRWGADDQIGTLNLITPDVRRGAARSVSRGISVSLARDVETTTAVDNSAPFEHAMIGVGTPDSGDDGLMHGLGADRFTVSFHGFVHSHIDALCHIFHDGKLYNGHPQAKVTPDGAAVLSVLNMKNGILTRGVLIDLPALLAIDYLPDNHVITVDELERWEDSTKTKVRPGDAILIRTGRWIARQTRGASDPMAGAPGVHPKVAFWLKDKEVSLVGSDFAMDALPSLVEGSLFPFHELAITAMGMPILDALDLEALSDTAANYKRMHFMLSVAPLAVPGATGSPVNPIATF